jgi:hypothetical protein
MPTSFHSGKGILPTTRHDNNDIHSIGGDHWTECNIGQKFLAVFLSGAQLQARAHHARVGFFYVVGTMFDVYLPQSLGDEDLDWLADKFALIVAKQKLGLTIDQIDNALVVRNDKGDRKTLYEFGEDLRFQRDSLCNLPYVHTLPGDE